MASNEFWGRIGGKAWFGLVIVFSIVLTVCYVLLIHYAINPYLDRLNANNKEMYAPLDKPEYTLKEGEKPLTKKEEEELLIKQNEERTRIRIELDKKNQRTKMYLFLASGVIIPIAFLIIAGRYAVRGSHPDTIAGRELDTNIRDSQTAAIKSKREKQKLKLSSTSSDKLSRLEEETDFRYGRGQQHQTINIGAPYGMPMNTGFNPGLSMQSGFSPQRSMQSEQFNTDQPPAYNLDDVYENVEDMSDRILPIINDASNEINQLLMGFSGDDALVNIYKKSTAYIKNILTNTKSIFRKLKNKIKKKYKGTKPPDNIQESVERELLYDLNIDYKNIINKIFELNTALMSKSDIYDMDKDSLQGLMTTLNDITGPMDKLLSVDTADELITKLLNIYIDMLKVGKVMNDRTLAANKKNELRELGREFGSNMFEEGPFVSNPLHSQ